MHTHTHAHTHTHKHTHTHTLEFPHTWLNKNNGKYMISDIFTKCHVELH